MKMLKIEDIPSLTPTGNYKVDVHLKRIKETILDFQESFGLDLDPEFQRGHVWTENLQIAYIEFLLQGGKSNPIYFNHPNWMKGKFEGNMVIVDGKQRITAILKFLNNKLPVFKNLDSENKGFLAKEISILPGTIPIVINNLPKEKQVLKWYLEMNQGNIGHSEEELAKVRKMIQCN